MTELEKSILARLDSVEEALKILLVNNVLSDAENLSKVSKKLSAREAKLEKEYQQKIEELQYTLKTREDRIRSLENQLENQKNRIQTLQQLSDSKDRTIQIKEERIQVLQKQTSNDGAVSSSGSSQQTSVSAQEISQPACFIIPHKPQDTVLDVYNSNNGALLHINRKLGYANNQRFMLEKHYGDYYLIRNVGTGMVLYAVIVKGVGTVKLMHKYGDSDASMLWKLKKAGNGYFMICSKLDEDYCLDAPYSKDGCVRLYKKNVNSYYQRFRLQAD